MFTISKDFAFSASHTLAGLPEHHPCSRLHGHNFVVRLHLSNTTLNEVGFVQDYRDLDVFKHWLDDTFDHRHLNDHVDFNPTAENMCLFLYEKAHEMGLTATTAVSWSETPKTWATYTPEDQ